MRQEATTATAPRGLAPARWTPPEWAAHPLHWVGVAGAAVGLGLAAAFQPVLALAGVAGVLVLAWVLARPVRGAYLFVLLVPVVVGVSRGALVPVLRPNEALIFLILGLAIVYATLGPADGRVRLGPLTPIDRAFGLLFVFGSLMPLATLLFRSGAPSAEDTFQLLSLVKYYAGYRLVLALVPGEREMVVVARLMIAASVVVAIVGLLQIARVADLHEVLARYYSAVQIRDSLELRRATSTLGVWQALGAYLAIHAALALTLLQTTAGRGRGRALLIVALLVDVVGSIATMTVTAVIALPLALGLAAAFGRQVRRTTLIALPLLLLALVVLWPAVEERWTYQFNQYGTTLAVPLSWEGRITNLTTVFWPLVQDNLLLGVAPSVDPNLPWLYAENQVMYLLYQGGILYAAAYFVFLVVMLRTLWRYLRRVEGPALAIARTAFIAWQLVFVLGLLDTHLTMPGEAESAWTLLALTVGAVVRVGETA